MGHLFSLQPISAPTNSTARTIAPIIRDGIATATIECGRQAMHFFACQGAVVQTVTVFRTPCRLTAKSSAWACLRKRIRCLRQIFIPQEMRCKRIISPGLSRVRQTSVSPLQPPNSSAIPLLRDSERIGITLLRPQKGSLTAPFDWSEGAVLKHRCHTGDAD